MSRRRPFALLWSSQALSQLGTSVSTLAYPLLVLQLTGSALQAGLVGTVSAAVGLVARIPGGALAGRFGYRRLMLAGDAVRAIVLSKLVVAILSGGPGMPLLLVLVGLEIAIGTVFGPAEFALARLLVEPGRRADAVARMQSRSQLAGLLGPLIGGGLFAVHPALPFAVDALSYLLSLGLVALIRVPTAASPAGPGEAFRSGLAAGWRWLRGEPTLLAAGFWVGALTTVFGGVGLAILVLAEARGASSAEIGAMFAISAAGGVLGALRARPSCVDGDR